MAKVTAKKTAANKVTAAKIIEMAEMAAADSRSQSIVVGAKFIADAIELHSVAQNRIADAIEFHTAAQTRMAYTQEKQLNITMENAEKFKEIMSELEESVKNFWEEIVNSNAYKKCMKDILNK